MVQYKRQLAAAFIASLAPVVQCGGVIINSIGNFSDSQLNEWMETPDAITNVPVLDGAGFSGLDVSQEWPGSPQPGWTLRIEIKGSVPVPDGYTSLTRLSYRPLGGVMIYRNDTGDWVVKDESWYICSKLWASRKLDVDDDDDDDKNAACGETLKGACRDELLDGMRNGFDASSSDESLRCPVLPLPEACASKLGDADVLAMASGVTLETNRMYLDYWYRFGSKVVSDQNDRTPFKEALKASYVVGTLWGYSNLSGIDAGSRRAVNASLTCLRAKEIDHRKSGAWRKGPGGVAALALAVAFAVNLG